MTPFAIAGLQLDLAAKDNLSSVCDHIRTTLRRYPWVQMVILSELAICGADPKGAETLPSATEAALGDVARDLNIWIVSGSLYEKSGDDVFNTATVLNPAGEIVTRYRKIYPFYPYEKGISAGSEPVTFDVPGVGRFGLSICYDIWFPETSRALALMGAEVIIHPTLTNTADRDVETAMVRATAAQQQCFVIDVNGAGVQACGHSVFAGPDGEVIHAAGDVEEIIVVEIDLDRVRRTRERGVLGLGQPLKSYRDGGRNFAHEDAGHGSDYLDTLGPLTMPRQGG